MFSFIIKAAYQNQPPEETCRVRPGRVLNTELSSVPSLDQDTLPSRLINLFIYQEAPQSLGVQSFYWGFIA